MRKAGSKPEFAAFGSNGCCLPPKCYADTPRRSYRNVTSAACRRGIIQTSALCTLCRPRHNTHWAGASHRLNRDLSRYHKDRTERAREELCADIGASFLCADLGIVPELEPRPDHASYVASWLKLLDGDRRAIFQAAAHAQRAVAYLHDLQPTAEIAEEAA